MCASKQNNRKNFLYSLVGGLFSFAMIPAHAELAIDQVQLLTESYARIKSAYVNEVDDAQLFEQAVVGMVGGLDPYSTYLTPLQLEKLKRSTQGQYGGLGVEVVLESAGVRVITPFDQSPAQRAGILPGDIITHINGQSLRQLTIGEVLELLRGDEGEAIALQIRRKNSAQPLRFDLNREVIALSSVNSVLVMPGIGYLRISQFQDHSLNDVYDELAKLEQLNQAPLSGLIIDLRNNPGGVLHAAVSVADLFLTEGSIVYTKGRIDEANSHFYAGEDEELSSIPIMVLINRGSASAAEILSGALQEHQRATVIGEPSYGKGSVQSVIPLPNGGALKITTAHYYTPNGRSLEENGIQPDILINTDDYLASVDPERPLLNDPFVTRAINELRAASQSIEVMTQ